MRSDLSNAAMAMESYYGDILPIRATQKRCYWLVTVRPTGVTLTINLTSPSTYTLTAARPAGTQPSFTFDSITGLIN